MAVGKTGYLVGKVYNLCRVVLGKVRLKVGVTFPTAALPRAQVSTRWRDEECCDEVNLGSPTSASSPVDINSEDIQMLGSWAVTEHNKQANDRIKFNKVVGGNTVIGGLLDQPYYLLIDALDRGGKDASCCGGGDDSVSKLIMRQRTGASGRSLVVHMTGDERTLKDLFVAGSVPRAPRMLSMLATRDMQR
ncbi:hypothetical protein EJB05_53308, partial [Eragrostis curvula]